MNRFKNPRVGKSSRDSWRVVVVVLAVCAVTISVATRYGGSGSEVAKATTVSVVKSHSQEFQRQRLLGNGLHWMAPSPSSTFFRPPQAAVGAASAEFTAIHLASEIWLCNRPPPPPPPSC